MCVMHAIGITNPRTEDKPKLFKLPMRGPLR
jgi:hypothetical protein